MIRYLNKGVNVVIVNEVKEFRKELNFGVILMEVEVEVTGRDKFV